MIKQLADRLFRWFCRKDLYPFIHGDLQENYRNDLQRFGKIRADFLYLKEVALLLRPNLIRKSNYEKPNNIGMIKNYIKITYRNLKRQWVYTMINTVGFSTGIISMFFILIFIKSEMSYDLHHDDADRLYRIATETTINGEQVSMATSPPGLSKRLLSDLPEIESSTRIVGFLGVQKNILMVEDRTFLDEGGYFADANFFALLTYKILAGDKETMLSEPQSMALSKSLAIRLFNTADALNKVVTVINDYGKFDYQVTGVYENEGSQSHINPTFICAMNSGSVGKFVAANDRVAGNNFLYTYVKINKGVNIGHLESKIPAFISKYVEDPHHTHRLVPITEIYLQSGGENEAGIGGDIRYIYILVTIAVLILVVACVNFANMATAQASKRTLEIGLRKTFGAQKKSITFQFLTESIILALIAMVISFIAIYLLAPYYSNLTGKEVPLNLLIAHLHWFVGLALLTGMMAGSYPALHLSTLRLQSTTGKSTGGTGSVFIRKVLVVFQFAVGILFILGTLITSRQLTFIQSKHLGFNSTDQIVVQLQSEDAVNQFENVKAAFSSIPGVHSVAGVKYTPAEVVLSDNHYWASSTPTGEGVVIRQNDVDYGLIETLGIELLAGRTFERDMSANDSSVVLNASAVKALGYTINDIVNQKIYTNEGEGVIGYRVIGVVSDFHAHSLHRAIEPYLFAMRPGRGVSSLIVGVDDVDRNILKSLEKNWKQLFPDLPFEFDLLDRQLRARYDKDYKFGKVIFLFSIVALILCLFGIFALTSFTVQQNLKTISIQKILGASARSIYISLVFRFMILILIGSVIAIPTGMILMNRWLALFAYRIEPGIVFGLIPMGIVALSALLVISYKILKVARVNPAHTLRSE